VLTVSPPGQVRLVNLESGLPKSRHGCPALLGERVPAFRHRRPVCRGQTAGLLQRHRRIAPQTDVPASSVNYYALHPRLRFRPADIEIKPPPSPYRPGASIALSPGTDKAVMSPPFLSHILPHTTVEVLWESVGIHNSRKGEFKYENGEK
jgi:hypothetical protein